MDAELRLAGTWDELLDDWLRLSRRPGVGEIIAGQWAELCYGEHLIEAGKMNSRFERFWYAIEHPLGPSRELGSYASHQESVEKLIREINARVHSD
jgi:hypothetical protein